MLQVGDITKLSGHTLPPVDVVIGGSPCQDLSVAGKGVGLSGKRSGLFMEQLRIVRELRNEDRQRGRTGMLVRPRFMLWENVPGAFSSNGGRDFQTVLQETIRIAEPDAPDIPCPKRWPMADAYFGDGWSVAYRVFDAQFWGVPQRRRRIALVADFGGLAAPEILFVRESLSGDIASSGETGKETAPGTGSGAYPAVARTLTAECDGSFDPEGRGGNIVVQGFPLGFRAENTRTYDEKATTICNGTRPGFACGVVQGVIPIHDKATRYQGGGATRNGDGGGNGLGVGKDGDPCPTLSTADRHAVFAAGFSYGQGGKARSIGWEKEMSPTLRSGSGGDETPCVFDARGNGDGKTVNTLTGDHESRVTDYAALVMSIHQNQCGEVRAGEVANTLSTNGNASGRNAPLIAVGLDSECNAYPEQYGTLKAHTSGGALETVAVAVDCRSGTESAVNGTLQAKESGGYSLNCQNVVRTFANILYGIVRRLTPLECERLQGFPDGWTDIGQWTDGKGKTRKTSDAARYRALGNSIALPPWKWVLKRISAQYERDATMGSLFDGIGGFPYLWEQINGKGSCVWASEIEEFCIAVSKKRIG